MEKYIYWFVSAGKQGDIYKAVLFQSQPLHSNRFNLAMGADEGREFKPFEKDKIYDVILVKRK